MKLPQLSLRDLFWLVLVSAMGLGWWLNRKALVTASDRHEFDIRVMKATLESAGYVVYRNDLGGLGIEPSNRMRDPEDALITEIPYEQSPEVKP